MTRQLALIEALRARPWSTLREIGHPEAGESALLLVQRGYLTRRRRPSWHGAWEYAVATTAPLTRPCPVVEDLIDSLRALGGTATVRELVEETGRDRALVAKALARSGQARRIGREQDRGRASSGVWTLCIGADTL